MTKFEFSLEIQLYGEDLEKLKQDLSRHLATMAASFQAGPVEMLGGGVSGEPHNWEAKEGEKRLIGWRAIWNVHEVED